MNGTPKLSVIIPVYNTSKYLRRCLESVVSQTYPALEVVIVDDGSTDNSAEICKEYVENHLNFKFCSLPNGGASKARNRGLVMSSGDFITFLDSDDYLQQDIYNMALNAFTPDIDIVSFGANTITSGGDLLSIDCDFDRIYAAEEIISDIVAKLKTAVWNKVFRKTAIDGISFPEEYSHNEDMVFLCECIKEETRMRSISVIGYNYVKHEASVTASPFTVKSFDEVKAKDRSVEIISEKFPDLYSCLETIRIKGRLNVLRRMAQLGPDVYPKEKAEIKNWLKNNINLRNADWKQKLSYFILMNDRLSRLIFG